MCKIISGDAVMGNFILESVRRNNFDISFEEMMKYDEKLSEKLKEHNYFTKFNFDEILDFTENYPFFVQSIESNGIKIVDEIGNKTNLMNQLIRYFRIGMPMLVVNEMITASKSILALE